MREVIDAALASSSGSIRFHFPDSSSLVERPAVNRKVLGSSPNRGAIFYASLNPSDE